MTQTHDAASARPSPAQVLIVGAGPAGLLAAGLLGRRGVQVLVVEKRATESQHPRARGLTTRSMEILSPCGLEPRLREIEMPAHARRFLWMESLPGEEVTRIAPKQGGDEHSATASCLVTQDQIEAQLLTYARSFPNVQLRLGTTLFDLQQQPDSVLARVRDGAGTESVIQAEYVIAADGAYSACRSLLGIGMRGQDNLGTYCSLYVRADLRRWLAGRESAGIFFTDARLRGRFLLAVDTVERWLFGFRVEADARASDEECLRLLRELVDDAPVPVQVLGKSFWTMASQVAERWQQARVFLVGDAAHRIPPTGGLGLNTGLHDVHNLVWKLHARIAGWGGSQLLQSYEVERRGVLERIQAWSLENASRYTAIQEAIGRGDKQALRAALADEQKHVDILGLDLGSAYASSILAGGGDAESSATAVYVPNAAPGHRAPHMVLRDAEGRGVSLHDLCHLGFVLLVDRDKQAWREAAAHCTAALGTPVEIHQLGGNAGDWQPRGDWRTLYAIEPGGAVLLRPDGYVAWRSRCVQASASTLERALAQAAGF